MPYSRCFTIIGAISMLSSCLFGQILIDTVAGGKIRSGVSAQDVSLASIAGVALDPSGNLVYCDSADSVIRRILSDGTIETIAGEGIPGYGGDGGTATKALLGGRVGQRMTPAGSSILPIRSTRGFDASTPKASLPRS
jgi:hypothetical protein